MDTIIEPLLRYLSKSSPLKARRPSAEGYDDDGGPQAACAENRARPKAQAHGEQKIARNEDKCAADHEMGERQVE